MKTVVISQPMYFPWGGMHEQMRLADDYVDYNDVAFSKGSFTNRVQVKTPNGITWLTIPLAAMRLGQPICEAHVDERQNWRRKHRSTLSQAYARAPFVKDMLALVDEVFETCGDGLGELAYLSMRVTHRYFGFEKPYRWHDVQQMGVNGSSTRRVLDVVKALSGQVYVTGHGARHYLEHDLFEREGVEVRYLDYKKKAYPQLGREFTPFVSALDLVANCGKEGSQFICSSSTHWQQFLS
jgi:hypothetical protein